VTPQNPVENRTYPLCKLNLEDEYKNGW